MYFFSFAIEISDIFGCTISKHRCEWTKITEGRKDRKLKVKRPRGRFHKWFSQQRSEHINPTVRLPYRYHITGNMYWRGIKKVHRTVTKIKTSWCAKELVTELYGRRKQTPGTRLYSPTEPQKTCSSLCGCEKDRYKVENSMNYPGNGPTVVTCGVIWEAITKVSRRCCTWAYPNLKNWIGTHLKVHDYNGYQWREREDRAPLLCLRFTLDSELKCVYKALSNIPNS